MTITTLPGPQATVPTVGTSYVPAPAGAPADAPRVFAAIAAVMNDAMPVGKNQRNEQQNYKFRGIDDVMSAMAGPMRKHGLFILPTIVEHKQQRDGKMTRTVITMRYSIYGPAGDCLVADVPGEAFDFADKSTNKAQSAALKYLLFTLFMLPVDGRSIDDGDRSHPEPTEEQRAEQAERKQRQRQQRQQPRPGNRSEAGPQQQPSGPRRDFLAEATKAPDPESFAKVRAAAVAAGAPEGYLARIDAIADQKRQQATVSQVEQPGDPDHAAAVTELHEFAAEAGLTDIDADAYGALGAPLADVSPAAIRGLLDQLRGTAA
jgi:hypothetical protein